MRANLTRPITWIIFGAIICGLFLSVFIKHLNPKCTIFCEDQIISYSESIDYGKISIEAEHGFWKKSNIEPSESNLIFEHSLEYFIGTQTVTVEYRNATNQFELTVLKTTNIDLELSFDGQNLNWKNLGNNFDYQLIINSNEYITSNNTYDLTFEQTNVNTLNISIQGISNFIGCDDTIISNITLKRNEFNLDVSINEYSLSWLSNESFNYYEVYLSSKKIYSGIDNRFSYDFPKQSFLTLVCIKDGQLPYLHEFQYETLGSIENVILNYDILSWDSVENAIYYDFTFNGETTSVYDCYIKLPIGLRGEVIIRAVGSNNNIDSEECRKNIIVNNNEFTVEFGMLSFEENQGIIQNLYIDNILIEENISNNFNINGIELLAGNHTIELKFMSSFDLFNERSNSLEIIKIESKSLTLTNGEITYTNSSNIIHYLDGEIVNDFDNLQPGTRYLSIVYKSENSDEVDSNKSELTVEVLGLSLSCDEVDSSHILFKFFIQNEKYQEVDISNLYLNIYLSNDLGEWTISRNASSNLSVNINHDTFGSATTIKAIIEINSHEIILNESAEFNSTGGELNE